MLHKVDSEGHCLSGLYIVFPLAYAVEDVPRVGLRQHPLQPTRQVFLCDESQLQDAVAAMTGENVTAQIVPLTDMKWVAKLLQHGMLGWLSAVDLQIGDAP